MRYIKKIKKYSITIVFVLFLVFGFMGSSPVLAATNPNLGAAETFSVLASTTISGTPTSISGDVGNVNAIGGSSITGVTGAAVTGTIYAQDLVAPSEGIIAAAVQANASTAYSTTAGLAPEGTVIGVSQLGGITRGPGVYDIPGNALLTSGVLTLDGPGTYIFRTGPASNFTSSAGGSINFINGARPCDLFWNIGTAAEIGGTSFSGTILASTGIHFTNAGVALNGRALAVGADVTLGVDGSISGPTCPAPAVSPTLNVIKHVVNDNGGTAIASAWTMTVTSSNGGSGTGNAVGSETGTLYTLQTDKAYSVAESGGPVGYLESDSANCVIPAAVAGTAYTCTITNDDIAPSLTLIKTVTNDSGTGSALDTAWTLTATGALGTPTNLTGTTPVVSGVTFKADTYTLAETGGSSGYTATAWSCIKNLGLPVAGASIALALNDSAICTINNNDNVSTGGGGSSYTPPVPPLIDLVKVPSPLALPAGPGPVTYTYTLRNTGTVPVTNITMVDDSCSPIIFVSGDKNKDTKLDVNEIWTYDCFKTLLATRTNIATATGWANGINAIDIATATVVVGAPVVPPLIHVTKVPSPLVLLAGAGTVIYKYTVTNPGTVPLSNVNITDDKCTGLPGRVVGHPGDLNKNNLLESNESWSFTCTSKLTKTTTNTAIASGDANGLTAKDFAIATVVVSAVPGLPKTGFAPTSWNEVILVSILMLISSSLILFLKKRKA